MKQQNPLLTRFSPFFVSSNISTSKSFLLFNLLQFTGLLHNISNQPNTRKPSQHWMLTIWRWAIKLKNMWLLTGHVQFPMKTPIYLFLYFMDYISCLILTYWVVVLWEKLLSLISLTVLSTVAILAVLGVSVWIWHRPAFGVLLFFPWFFYFINGVNGRV